MLATVEELAKFSGTTQDTTDETVASLLSTYIGTATEQIQAYVGYDPEEKYETVPSTFKLVCLEIAALIQLEERNNLGVNNQSYSDMGSRSFLNTVDYSKYLSRLSQYREVSNG